MAARAMALSAESTASSPHQQDQQQQHLTPLVRLLQQGLQQGREALHRFHFHSWGSLGRGGCKETL